MAPGARNRIKCDVGRGSNPSRPRWKPAYARKLAFDCTADSNSWRQVSSQLRQYYERSPNLGVFFPSGPPASRRSPPPRCRPCRHPWGPCAGAGYRARPAPDAPAAARARPWRVLLIYFPSSPNRSHMALALTRSLWQFAGPLQQRQAANFNRLQMAAPAHIAQG